jgi:hypothetical protein
MDESRDSITAACNFLLAIANHAFSVGSTLERLDNYIKELVTNADGSVAFPMDERLRAYVLKCLTGPTSSIRISASTDAKAGRESQATDIVWDNGQDPVAFVETLKARYGNRLRFVADNAAIRAATNGNIDLSLPQIRVLQNVMRSRGHGASFPTLCKLLNTNTSNIYFQVKSLCDLGLLVKTRSESGRGPLVSHAVAVKYAHLSPLLTASRMITSQTEPANSQSAPTKGKKRKKTQKDDEEEGEEEDDEDDAPDLRLTQMSQRTLTALSSAQNERHLMMDEPESRPGDNDTLLGDEDFEAAEAQSLPDDLEMSGLIKLEGLLAFPEIKDRDAVRALARDKKQLRYRILKLVTESRNMTTTVRGLTVRLGVRRFTKLEGRAMRTEVKPMVDEGLLEFVPALDQDEKGDKIIVKCLRATEQGVAAYHQCKLSPHMKELRRMSQKLRSQMDSTSSSICVEAPIERQILEQIARSGSRGLTIDAMHKSFCGSEERKRDLDRWLNAMRSASLPQYYDLKIDSTLEQAGRARLSRFWSQFWLPDVLTSSLKEKGSNSSFSTSSIVSALSSAVNVPLEIPLQSNSQTQTGSLSSMQSSQQLSVPDSMPSRQLATSIADGTAIASTLPVTPARPKGRPRKNFSQEAIDKANRTRLAKGLPPLPEQNQVPQSSPIPTPPAAKRRKTVGSSVSDQNDSGPSITSGPSVEPSTLGASQKGSEIVGRSATVSSHDRAKGHAAQQKVDRSIISQDTNRAISTIHGPDELPSTGNMVELPTRAGDKLTRSNMTMQLKFDKMREFFEHVKVIEATQIERAYQRFVLQTVTQETKRPPYDMDRKVRNRLLTALDKAGVIRSRNTVGPASRLPGSRTSMMTLYYHSDVDIRQVQSYGRKLIDEVSSLRRTEDTSWKENVPIGAADVDMPTSSALAGRTTAQIVASSLEDLVKDPTYREQLASQAVIRAYYTGRIVGGAARMDFVHQQIWTLLSDPGETSQSRYVIDRENGVVDMQWWATDASLWQTLSLVIVPNEDAILEASQDDVQLKRSISQLEPHLRSCFQLSKTGHGTLQDTLQVIMHMLVSLGLAEPHTTSTGATQQKEDWTVYRFLPSSRQLKWSLEDRGETDASSKMMKVIRTWDKSYFSDAAQRKQFWATFSRASKFDQQRRPSEKQTLHGEEVGLDENTMATLSSPSQWSTTYKMFRAQVFLFDHSIQLGVTPASLDDTELLRKLSYAAVVPLNFVKRFYMRRFGIPMVAVRQPKERTATLATARQNSITSRKMVMPQRVQIERLRPPQQVVYPMTKRQALRIAREARRARLERKEEFDDVVDEFMGENNIDDDEREILIEGLRRARDAYANGQDFMTMEQVKAMLKSIQRLHVSGEPDSYNALVRQTTAPRARKMHKAQATKSDAQDSSVLAVEEKSGRKRAGRKSGFEWTADMDELLRDCGVVLRARDKYRSLFGNSRKNWAALKQVFPANNSSALLNRFMKLQTAVGEEAYLAQLEVAWTKLWVRHRGTSALPDENPRDATAFNLREHVSFLRDNVSKIEVMETLRRGADDPLPLDVGQLATIYDLERPFVASTVANVNSITPRYVQGDSQFEMRGDVLERAALTTGMFECPDSSIKTGVTAAIGLAKSVVKMILGTQGEQYDESVATQLCQDNCTETDISRACRSLMLTGILKHKSSEGRLGPNRNLTFTDDWQSFMSDEGLETLPPWQTISHALRFIELDQLHDDNRTMTLFQSVADSEAATFITLAEAGAVNIDIDTKPIANFSQNRLFNAKKLTDADLELPLSFSKKAYFDAGAMIHTKMNFDMLLEGDAILDVGSRWLGQFTMRQDHDHLSHWQSCFQAVEQRESPASPLAAAYAVLKEALLAAGQDGITRSALRCLSSGTLTIEVLAASIDSLRAADPPLVYETGDDELRLVATCFALSASVVITSTDGQQRRILPRPWLDIRGCTVARIWHDAVALILFAIYMRPGVKMAQLVAHMTAAALCRSDVVHIVQCISQSGLADFQLSGDPSVQSTLALWQADDDAQLAICWAQAHNIC